MAKRSELITAGMAAPTASAVGGTVVTGLVADTGSAQAGAELLTGVVNVVGTVGTIGDSLLLPVASTGDEIWVRNNAANSADVFPQVGGAINGGSANAALAVAGAKTAIFKCISGSAGNWIAVVTA